MFYVIRRRKDDMYLSYDSEAYSVSWRYSLDDSCYFDKDELEYIKTEMGEAAADFLIYTIVNPSGKAH